MILKQPVFLSPRMLFNILLFPIFATAFDWQCQDFQLYPNGQCNKFVRCVGHIPVVMACPTNTKFNKFLKVCDWPYNVACTSSTATTTIITRGTTPRATRKTTTWRPPPITTTPHTPTDGSPGETFACPTNIVWGLFPDYKSNCKYYFECQSGRSRHIACPRDLVFNTLTLNCNRPENSECKTIFRRPRRLIPA